VRDFGAYGYEVGVCPPFLPWSGRRSALLRFSAVFAFIGPACVWNVRDLLVFLAAFLAHLPGVCDCLDHCQRVGTQWGAPLSAAKQFLSHVFSSTTSPSRLFGGLTDRSGVWPSKCSFICLYPLLRAIKHRGGLARLFPGCWHGEPYLAADCRRGLGITRPWRQPCNCLAIEYLVRLDAWRLDRGLLRLWPARLPCNQHAPARDPRCFVVSTIYQPLIYI